jgi:hypothetical protein
MYGLTKSKGIVQSTIQIAIAAGVALLISLEIFVVGDAFASDDLTITPEESQQYDEGARMIVMNCPGEKEKRVTLKVIDDTVKFKVDGCYCTNEPENLKKKVLEVLSDKKRKWKEFPGVLPGAPLKISSFESVFGPITVEAGKTVTKTYNCYSAEQLNQLLRDLLLRDDNL